MASRVVPGISETIARSCPSSALTRLDLPTFGRPTNAIEAGSVSASAAIAASHFAASAASGSSASVAPSPSAASPSSGSVDDERLEPAGGHLVGPGVGLGLARLAGELLRRLGRQRPHDRVEQVAGPAAVRGRDRVRLLPAERVELHALELALLVVGLVDGDEDRRGGAAQQLGRLGVGRRQARDRVDHEDDDVGLGDREAGLLLDAGLDRVVRVDLEAAGVDEHEPPAVPLGVAVQAVAGRPRAVLDDRRARPEDAVEERALADVRAADDGDDRERPAEPRRRRRCGGPC